MECLQKYCKIAVVGMMMAIIYHFFLGYFFGLGWSFNTFLFRPDDRFMDFFNTMRDGRAVLAGEPNIGAEYYPFTPGYIWMTYIFKGYSNFMGLVLYLATIVLFFGGFIFKKINAIPSITTRNAIIATCLIVLTSYPVLFLVDRGNQEGLQFVLLVLFLLSFSSKSYLMSAFWLVLAFCMKPFALVFAVMYLSRDKWKYIAVFIFGICLATWITFSVVPGGFIHNLHSMLVGYQNYDEVYVLGAGGAQFNHTIYTPIWFANMIYGWVDPIQLKNLYFLAMTSIFLGLTYYVVLFEMVLWRKIFVLCLAMVGLPFISADYTLIHLYIPAVLMFQSYNAEADDKTKSYYKIITILLALLMIPKQYLSGFVVPIGVSVIINPILIYMLLFVLVKFGLDERKRLIQIG